MSVLGGERISGWARCTPRSGDRVIRRYGPTPLREPVRFVFPLIPCESGQRMRTGIAENLPLPPQSLLFGVPRLAECPMAVSKGITSPTMTESVPAHPLGWFPGSIYYHAEN